MPQNPTGGSLQVARGPRQERRGKGALGFIPSSAANSSWMKYLNVYSLDDLEPWNVLALAAPTRNFLANAAGGDDGVSCKNAVGYRLPIENVAGLRNSADAGIRADRHCSKKARVTNSLRPTHRERGMAPLHRPRTGGGMQYKSSKSGRSQLNSNGLHAGNR